MSADESEESWQTGDRARASRGRRPEMRVLSRTLPRFLAAHRAGGLDTDKVLLELNLTAGSDHKAAVEIALEPLRSVTDRIAEELREPTLGLRLAQSLPPTAMGLVELALRAAPTLQEGLERFARYSALFSPLEAVELAVRGDEVEFAHRVPGTRRALGAQGNELFVMWMVRTIREVLGRMWAPTEVCMAHAAPPDSAALTQAFAPAALRFAMGFNALRFPASELSKPSVTADPEILAMVDGRAERVFGQSQTDDVLARIRTEIQEQMRDGRPTLQTVAEKLGASPRTLQRRLDAHNTTFNDLVEATRLALAKEFLASPRLGLKEIAFRLGYSDLTTFIRAFKRVTSLTPLEFRKKAGAG